ncbi:MAG: SHOCT domain-containing protein [Phycisphaerales bacterium]|nr:SHOCT domain-containing protein [Phycisphaerales bacterium]
MVMRGFSIDEENFMVSFARLTVLAMAIVLGGCIGIGGTSNQYRPTTGQELVDLKMALDRGVITPQEYEQQKAAILARPK